MPDMVLHTQQLPMGCIGTAVLDTAPPHRAQASASTAACFTSQLGARDMSMHLPAGGAPRLGPTS